MTVLPVAHIVVCGHSLGVVVHHDRLLSQSSQFLTCPDVFRYSFYKVCLFFCEIV
jgi:hypothetical protein